MRACKDLVEHVVKSLVDKPEEVTVTTSEVDGKVVISLKVNEGDLGRVIGKDGQTIRALRALALVVVPQGQEISVDVLK